MHEYDTIVEMYLLWSAEKLSEMVVVSSERFKAGAALVTLFWKAYVDTWIYACSKCRLIVYSDCASVS